jgi:hypothetical protein
MEEHGGVLVLDDAAGGGACIRLLFRVPAADIALEERDDAVSALETVGGERAVRGA